MNYKAIDTHAHLWPNAYLDQLKKLGSKDTDVARNIGSDDSDESIRRRIAMMDKAGVDFQVLSATPQAPQWGSAEEALKLAQTINNRYAEIIRAYPGRFRAYAAVPLPYVDESIVEAKRAVQELGFFGVAVNTLVRNEVSIADDQFLPFYEAIDTLETVLYIHPTGCGANSNLINDYGLEWVIGAPVEDLIMPLHVLKKELPQKFPKIKFHIAHLGGGLPFLMQRIEDNFEDWNAFVQSPTKSLKEHFWFDTANFHKPSLVCSCETFGADRILMGSDFPYFQNEKYTRSTQYIKDATLTDTDKIKILRTNAEKLYDL